MNEIQDFIGKYLDDSLTEEELAHLKGWLEADEANLREFVVAVARDEQLRNIVKSTGPATAIETVNMLRPTAHEAHRYAGIVKWLTVASLIIAVSWFILPSENNASVVTFEGANGPVSLQTADGIDRGLESGKTFTTGLLLVDGNQTRANFSYADGSTMLIAGGTELVFTKGSGKQLVLNKGTLAAHVSPQSKRHPLVLRTRTAEAITEETSFIIDADEMDTLLRVNEGTVRIRRLADNKTLLVAQNQQVQTDGDTNQPLQAEAVKPVSKTWKAHPKAKGNLRWGGNWTEEGTLKAEGREIFLKALGVNETHYHAGVHDEFPGLATLDDDSAIRIRYRIDRELNVGLFLSTRSQTWNFTGNLQAYVEADKTPPGTDGWRTATIPISSFQPTKGSGRDFKPNCLAATLFATTYADNVGLEVANLEVITLESDGSR